MEKKSKVLLQNRICSCSRVFSSNKQFIDMKYLDKIVALYTNIEGTVIKMGLSGIDVDTKTYSLVSSIRTSTGNIRIDNTNAEGSAIYEYGHPYASINEFNEKCDVSADLNIFANSCAMANTVLGFQVNNGADMKFK